MARLKLVESENDVKKLCVNWFEKYYGWSFAPVSRGMGVHGIPDRVGCIPITITQEMVGKTVGLFVGLEAKRPGRRGEQNAGASGLQVNQLERIIDAGGVGFVVDSQEDLDLMSGLIVSIRAGYSSIINRCKELFLKRINKNG